MNLDLRASVVEETYELTAKPKSQGRLMWEAYCTNWPWCPPLF